MLFFKAIRINRPLQTRSIFKITIFLKIFQGLCREAGQISRYKDGLRDEQPEFDSQQGQGIFVYSTASVPELQPI
jgi:hypothetical protein